LASRQDKKITLFITALILRLEAFLSPIQAVSRRIPGSVQKTATEERRIDFSSLDNPVYHAGVVSINTNGEALI